MDKKAIISTIVGIVLFLFLLQFIPESHCGDGWSSSSIGSRGACSHHGGVTSYGHIGLLFLIISIIAGVLLYNTLSSSDFQKKLKGYLTKIIEAIKAFFFSLKGILLIAVIALVVGISIGSSGVISNKKVATTKVQDIINEPTNDTFSNARISKPRKHTYYEKPIQNTVVSSNYIGEEDIQIQMPKLLNENNPGIDCGVGGRYSDIFSECSCDSGYGKDVNGKCEKKDCGVGGRYSDTFSECSCDSGYGKGVDGKCEKRDCGVGGRYSDTFSECSCDSGYGKGVDGKCERKTCPKGQRYSSILEECTNNGLQLDYKF